MRPDVFESLCIALARVAAFLLKSVAASGDKVEFFLGSHCCVTLARGAVLTPPLDDFELHVLCFAPLTFYPIFEHKMGGFVGVVFV